MSTRRIESTIVALNEKIEKTKNATKEKLLFLKPLEDEHKRLKFEKQKANDFNEENLKAHANHLKSMDRDMVQFRQDFHRRKRSAGATSETEDFHALLETKREETRQLREKSLKLKAEVLSGIVQVNEDAPSCEVCTDEYNEDENMPKVLGECRHGHEIVVKKYIGLYLLMNIFQVADTQSALSA
ncbi:hypothetical protein GCK72_025900 [Caenorhabditis remanei]|uniref:Uncharacterized protein n=1 Tax=Caenorhabditis remanei TaxID=31234 RepID=A0A6A5G411_CAERE|nr:hypothetical protein GCK72_025900 [Caenorhabditis remanei]KAF1749432.1 hypothetical protein GCK72_025900 [Caenorhabditis remanei]